jgi:uncharacterized protein YndB with AHSA1/START domain
MSITHSTFTIERGYDATPAQVFAAFADPKAKARWFTGPDEWTGTPHELDFRVGGIERVSGGTEGSPTFSYLARYQDIVPDERIVTTYEMHRDQTRLSVSLASVQFEADGAGTRLTYTEHGAYLDGEDTPESREEGTRGLLDQLGVQLAKLSTDAS